MTTNWQARFHFFFVFIFFLLPSHPLQQFQDPPSRCPRARTSFDHLLAASLLPSIVPIVNHRSVTSPLNHYISSPTKEYLILNIAPYWPNEAFKLFPHSPNDDFFYFLQIFLIFFHFLPVVFVFS